MKLYKAGDKSKALCNNCGIVSTTVQYRDIVIETISIYTLVGVCDKCNSPLTTFPQSELYIKSKLKEP